MKRGNHLNFPSLGEIVDDNESSSLISSVCEETVARLEVLSTLFDRHFDVGKTETFKEWIMNSYSFSLDKMPDNGELKENLTELRSNCAVEMQSSSRGVLTPTPPCVRP